MSPSVSVPALFEARVRSSLDRLALQEFGANGVSRPLSWSAWHQQSRQVSAALVASGIRPGDRVAVLAGNSNLWPVAQLGILGAGAISVGIYPTSSVEQVGEQLADSAARAAIVDTPAQFERICEATRAAGNAGTPMIIAPDEIPPGGSRAAVSWSAWLATGADALAADSEMVAELERRVTAIRGPDDALFIYTSGSTGEPKAARISHRCAISSAESIRDTLGLVERDSTISVLPYCHAGEQLFGLVTRILTGMSATHVADHSRLWSACRDVQPTVFGGLPRFYEKAYDALLAERRGLAEADAAEWDQSLARGAVAAEARQAGQVAVAEPAPVVRRAVARLFGSRLRLATSGGAALPVRVAEYLDACGVTILGAYGQTEHLCVAFNRGDRYRHDAAGHAMPGTTLRIAADGEVLVKRSALTFSGYHNREAESRDAFTDDGTWLRTGDLGDVNGDGMLRIVGRKKELIALSNGKKVAPLVVERLLNEQAPIGHAVLCGEGRPYVTAVIALRDAWVDAWRERRGVPVSYSEVAASAEARAEVQAALQSVNARFSRPEQVRRFVLATAPLSVDAGDLTPTLKVRRSIVLARYRAAIDALYEETA